MEAKIIMGNKIAVVTNDRDEFGDPHKTERIISYDAAIKLMMELGHCVDIVQEKTADQNQWPAGVREDYVSEEKSKYELASDLINCVPTSWLDPLLSGKNKVLPGNGPFSCADIERLLQAIRKKMEEKAGI